VSYQHLRHTGEIQMLVRFLNRTIFPLSTPECFIPMLKNCFPAKSVLKILHEKPIDIKVILNPKINHPADNYSTTSRV